MGFLYETAQINQKCISTHSSFNVLKQSFLLRWFSVWNARVMLGLLALLFPSYVMWIHSKCHFSVSFLEHFCVFECCRDKNIWLLLQPLKGRDWSRFHGVLHKTDLKSLCDSWWSDSCVPRISGSFHKVWRFLRSPCKGRSLLLMREQAFVSDL